MDGRYLAGELATPNQGDSNLRGVTPEQHREVQDLFAAHGYNEPLQVAHAIRQDEYVFLLPSTALATLPEVTLTHELQHLLRCKVWIKFADPRSS